jgi:hypothetical protein
VKRRPPRLAARSTHLSDRPNPQCRTYFFVSIRRETGAAIKIAGANCTGIVGCAALPHAESAAEELATAPCPQSPDEVVECARKLTDQRYAVKEYFPIEHNERLKGGER